MAATVSASKLKSTPQGSGFSNLQNYLRANAGNQLAGVVGAGIGSAANQVSQNLAGAQSKFSQGISNPELDPSNTQNLAAREAALSSIASGTPNISSQDEATFQRLLSGQYRGPAGLAGASGLQEQAQGAKKLGAALSTSGGKQGLLEQFVGGPGYTSGQKRADVLLMGQSPQLSQARQKSQALVPQIGTAVQSASSIGGQKQQEARQTAAQTKQQLGSATEGIVQPLQQKFTDWSKIQDQAKKDFLEGKLTKEELAQAGLTPEMATYGVDPTQYLKTPQLSLGGLTSETERAQLAALAKLSGAPADQFVPGYQPTLQPSLGAQNPYEFDTSKFKEDITSRKQQLDEAAKQQGLSVEGLLTLFNMPNTPQVTVKGAPQAGFNLYNYDPLLGQTFKQLTPYKSASLGATQENISQAKQNLQQALPQIYAEAHGIPVEQAQAIISQPGFDPSSILQGSQRSDTWKKNLVNALGRYQDNINAMQKAADATSEKFWSQYGQKITERT